MKQQGLKNNLRQGIALRFCLHLWVMVLSLGAATTVLAGPRLESVDFTTLPGDNIQIQFSLSGPAAPPKAFSTDNPARIALDMPGVSNGLEKKPISINAGGAQSIQAIEASGRTRVIVNLSEMMPYQSRVEGNKIFLTLQRGVSGPYVGAASNTEAVPAPVSRTPRRSRPAPAAAGYDAPYPASGDSVRNVDFRRGPQGEGRLLVTLSDPGAVAQIREEGRKVIIDIPGLSLPANLARRLDVLDFATPVQTIDSEQDGGRARLVVTPVSQDYDYSSYQSGNVLTVEFRPLTRAEKEEIKKKSFAYGGEKLTLNFQDIPVRSVLQILADFTNLNIVASDTVQGNVTLRLNDVPWDQALDLVLKSKGLGKRQEGNIIRVAPLDEINRLEKDELEAAKVVEELEPLKTEIIQVNYTKADDIKTVLMGTTEKTSQTTSEAGIGGSRTSTSSTSLDVSQSILSGRGNVTTDQRTNQLIIKDTARNLERIRDLIRKLDIPVRQVLIESRVVIANNDFSRRLGSRLSVSTLPTRAETLVSQTSNTAGNLLSTLSAANPYGTAGMTVLKAGDYLLDLELTAAQTEGRGEIVSNPRLITSDQTKAVIKQGVEIPYQIQSSAGGALVSNIQFKQAVLELNVTPHITPDDNILMDLLVKKDSKGEITPGGFGIDKREIETQALVGNGETVVLGGVYEGTKTTTTDKVPFLGDLPGVGFMFRRNETIDQKKELLIFVTPKILKQQMVSR